MKNMIFFFLGTEAELIKMFPVIMEAKRRGIKYRIISSGQNDIVNSTIFKTIGCGTVDLELSKESDIKKTAAGLLDWWFKTYNKSVKLIRDAFADVDFKNSQMLVHGDTVSTYMGARIGKKLGMQVCHVEAGLRSHNIFKPFPEEIDRLLTSSIARVHFAPGELACSNLKKAKGQVVNTKQNTLLDSLYYSRTIHVMDEAINDIINGDKYFVFVMHRQENLVSKDFVDSVIKEIEEASVNCKCVLLLHKITENALVKFGIMDRLKDNTNIKMIPRVQYFDFMKLLDKSEFVITDGGSNQEELYYMNKPCLILRTVTERNEGIGINARLFDGSAEDIKTFIINHEIIDGRRELQEESPSRIIVDYLR